MLRVSAKDGLNVEQVLESIVTPDVFAAAKHLRERNSFERDDGTPLYYTLVNIKDWCKNNFEVVNQLRISTDYSHHRYDVILLINGVPVVQIELKTLAISPRRAMQQIVDYKNDPGNGYTKTLLCFLQLFIVSNRSDTWYFANNNSRHFSFNADERFLPLYQFAAEDNSKITHLDSFADAFLVKCTLGQMISRYMVLVASEQKLLMMRPYQIYAVKAIVECIHQRCGNGYIWHTTGSGKTLTSFKASTLLKDNPDIDKCLFVVDRKDLDRQTREEFNKFQEGCVEENTNTETLVRRFSETRRKHPLSKPVTDSPDFSRAVVDAIELERELLSVLREHAHVIDTSLIRPSQLQAYIKDLIRAPGDQLTLVFESFAFKRGIPVDADYVFDVRMLPNPYYEPDLRPLSGKDEPVASFLRAQADTGRMLADIETFLNQWLDALVQNHRSYVTVALGCTGGQHRSVYLVEELASRFTGRWNTLKRHRELDAR